jgi:Amt family ammonium transporter
MRSKIARWTTVAWSLGLVSAARVTAQETEATIDTGDTAWILTSSALVLFMTPGLALFYAGMTRSKNVLGTTSAR